jgi:chromate reductase
LRKRYYSNGFQLYNQDMDADPPAEWVAFRERIRRADAVIFVTPDYRSPLTSLWQQRLAQEVSRNRERFSRRGRRQPSRWCSRTCRAMRQPEAYVGGADKLFDAEGMLTNPSPPEFLGKHMRAFAAWIEKAGTPA